MPWGRRPRGSWGLEGSLISAPAIRPLVPMSTPWLGPTGGPDRVEVALRLLAGGGAERLLISGAGERTDLPVLARFAGIDPAPLEQRITMGYTAHSTRGNASETAAWVRENKVATLLVVTGWFHMPRALVELRCAMPEATDIPIPLDGSPRPSCCMAGVRGVSSANIINICWRASDFHRRADRARRLGNRVSTMMFLRSALFNLFFLRQYLCPYGGGCGSEPGGSGANHGLGEVSGEAAVLGGKMQRLTPSPFWLPPADQAT